MYKKYNRYDKQLITTFDWLFFKSTIGVLFNGDETSLSLLHKTLLTYKDDVIDKNNLICLLSQIDDFMKSIFDLHNVVSSQSLPMVDFSYSATSYSIYELCVDTSVNDILLGKAVKIFSNPDYLLFIKHIRLVGLMNANLRLEIHGVHHRLKEDEDFIEANMISRIDIIDTFLGNEKNV